MRIHIASHMFTPRPQGAFCAELAEHWAAQGHDVVVFTADGGASGQPPGGTKASYRVVGGLRRRYGRTSLWDRLTSRLTFARSAWAASSAEARENGSPDLYLSAGALPAIAAVVQRWRNPGRRRDYDGVDNFGDFGSGAGHPVARPVMPRPRLVVWLFDLWPDVLRAHHPSSRVIRWTVPLLSFALARLLTRVDSVVTISPAMTEVMRARVPTAHVHTIPLWAPNEGGAPRLSAMSEAEKEDGAPFRAVYHGNLGLSYDFDQILACARRFPPSEVQFLLVGDGARKDALEAHIAREAIPNVRVCPPVSLGDLWSSLATADAYLLPLRETWDVVSFPSKVLAYLAGGRPIVVSGASNGETARMVRDAQCGLTVPATGEGLEQALRLMIADRATCRRFGRAGRHLYETRFAAQRAFKAWDELIRSPPTRLTEPLQERSTS